MSLLMDALRKAEEEKRKAASTQSPTDASTSGEVAPDAGSQPRAQAGESTWQHTDELRLAPIETPPSAPAGDSLELALEDVTVQGAATPPGVDTTVETARPGQPYDQESTLPSERAIRSSLEEYFEASQSLDTSRLSIPHAPLSETTAIDGNLGTPVSAQTVFAASRAPASARAMNLVIASAVLVTLALATGGVWYMLQTPSPHATPSPLVAKGVELPVAQDFVVPEILPPQAAPTIPDASEPLPTVVTAIAPAGAEAPGAPAETPSGPEAPPAAATAAVTAMPGVPAAAPPPPEPEVDRPAATAAPAPVAAAPVTAGPPEPAAPEPGRAVAKPVLAATSAVTQAPLVMLPGEIRITRGRSAAVVNADVADGYQALLDGDLGRAESHYRTALAADPGNRDTLLGLAALASRKGDPAAAYAAYRRVLRAHPGDSVASAAMFSLQGYAGPGVSESTLKLMLDRDPQAAFLHFVLGNFYARQQRWAEAEEAYFHALALDQDNGDFAFNLAVSLDRLGERAAALEHYRRALELADDPGATFNTTAALDRIQTLAGSAAAP